MPSTKNSQVSGQRRISQPGPGNNLRGPEPVTSASSKPSSSATTTGAAAASSSSSTTSSTLTTTTSPPITMTPISQILNGPRRTSRLGPGGYRSDDNPAAWDPEHYNPDGSLRTVHKMPAFEQTYAQAMNARYIRHRETLDREKELSVKQIFDKS